MFARSDRTNGDYDWATFKAQQAGSSPSRGYVRATLQYVTGRSVVRLLASPGLEPPESIVDCAKAPSKVYIRARYLDAYDSGAPMDYYMPADADAAIERAGRIVDWLNALASR